MQLPGGEQFVEIVAWESKEGLRDFPRYSGTRGAGDQRFDGCAGARAGKQLDLFGVLVLAVVTAFGGGVIRDLLVGRHSDRVAAKAGLLVHGPGDRIGSLSCVPLVAAAGGAVANRRCRSAGPLQCRWSASKAVSSEPGRRASRCMLGVITGVAGGIVRDTLLGQVPMVFRRNTYLYAQSRGAEWCAVYGVAEVHAPGMPMSAELSAVALCFLLRLAALRWRLALPEMH